jgi:integrase/recombinase XerD
MTAARTPARKKARQLAKYLRGENPDYDYLKSVFRHLREELEITIARQPKHLPYVPSEAEIKRLYKAVWQARKSQDMVLIKTFLYTGVRVSELIKIHLADVDLDRCQIRITMGKGAKDRVVPFPVTFREVLAMHIDASRNKHATYLFESSWKRRYTDRGVRKLLARYAAAAGLQCSVTPHQLRHFLLTWLKKQGLDDALIQPYSGHESRKSLEIYSRLAIGEAQAEYDRVMGKFPV